jgi:hypothetical protein
MLNPYLCPVITRWRLWLLHGLILCLFISAFEVNTQPIVNTWGDYWEAYLPVKFLANSVQSIAASSVRSVDCLSQSQALTSSFRWPTPGFYQYSNRAVFSRFSRIYLQCCQWLI